MSRLTAYAQLVRLPNVFTAMADICLGALVTGALPERWPAFVLLLAASSCLYCAGMVWNDYFDVEQDRRERPFRPLPSGRVSPREAAWLGTLLLAAGLALAFVVSFVLEGGSWLSFFHASLLAVTILLYDAWLKRTWSGPIAMGTCRFLNVLLGLSVLPQAVGHWGVPMALTVGVYVGGVTWFARTEARESNQNFLAGAALVMLFALLLAVPLPALVPPPPPAEPEPVVPAALRWGRALFPYLLVAFALYVGIPVVRAIFRPVPWRVQAAVKRCVLGLVVLDAVLATFLAGPLALALILLLLPALYLGRWLYST